MADLETGQEVTLLKDPHAEVIVAPDGSAVVYCRAVSHYNMNLYMLRLNPPASPNGLPSPSGKPLELAPGEGVWHVHNGEWSPDGKEIVYTRDTDAGDIYVIENQ